MYGIGILPPPARGRERPGKQSSGLLQRTACGSRTGRGPQSGRRPMEYIVNRLTMNSLFLLEPFPEILEIGLLAEHQDTYLINLCRSPSASDECSYEKHDRQSKLPSRHTERNT